MNISYKNHKLYKEYISLINDDTDFKDMFSDNENDFNEWVLMYEIDQDWNYSHADEA